MAEAGAARGALQWRQPLNGALGRKWRGEQAEKKGRTLLGKGSLRSRGSVIPARLGSGACATDLWLWLPEVPSPPQKPWAAKGSGKVFGGFSVFFSSRTPPPMHTRLTDLVLLLHPRVPGATGSRLLWEEAQAAGGPPSCCQILRAQGLEGRRGARGRSLWRADSVAPSSTSLILLCLCSCIIIPPSIN